MQQQQPIASIVQFSPPNPSLISSPYSLTLDELYRVGPIHRILFIPNREADTESPALAKETLEDASVDIGVILFSPKPIEHKDLQAKPESGDSPHKLITSLTEAEKTEVSHFMFRILM